MRASGRVSLPGRLGRQCRAGPGRFPRRRACPWPRRVTQPEHVVRGRASAAPASRERAFQALGGGRRREQPRQQRRPRGRRGSECCGLGSRGHGDGGERGRGAGREMDAPLACLPLFTFTFSPPCGSPSQISGRSYETHVPDYCGRGDPFPPSLGSPRTRSISPDLGFSLH